MKRETLNPIVFCELLKNCDIAKVKKNKAVLTINGKDEEVEVGCECGNCVNKFVIYSNYGKFCKVMKFCEDYPKPEEYFEFISESSDRVVSEILQGL